MISTDLMLSSIDHLLHLEEIARGEAPSGWQVGSLGTFLLPKRKVDLADDNIVPFLPMASIADGFSGQCTPESRKWGEVRKGYTTFESGNVLVAKITPCFQNRKSTIAPATDMSIGAGTTELHVLRPCEALSCRYLLWLTKSDYFIRTLLPQMTGTAGQKRVPRHALDDVVIGFPTLPEQERIANQLDAIQAEISVLAALEREREDLDNWFYEAIRRSFLRAGISGQLVEHTDEDVDSLLERVKAEKRAFDSAKTGRTLTPSEVEIEAPFTIPQNWRWARLGTVLTLINGRAYKQQEMHETGKWPILRVGNLFTSNQWYFSDLDLPNDKYCDPGDLIYAWSASFGPFIWTGSRSIFHYHIWNVKYFSLNRDYVFYALLDDAMNLEDSKTGTTMAHVSMKSMVDRPLPIPGLAEQARIAQVLNTGMKCIDELAKLS